MFLQVQQALDCLTAALDGVEAAPTGELRRTLGLARLLRSRVELLETKAASVVAQRECHGDGGAGLLNQVGGRSRSEAARNVRVEAELAELPAARTAVADGEISLANAAKLAQAARKTSPDAVQGDVDLVEMAKTLAPDEFAQAAQRWTIRHQSTEDLAEQHRRNRRNRNVRFWNGDDGSVQMRGSFDAEMGARIQQRLRQQAEQLRQADRLRQTQSQHQLRDVPTADDAVVPVDEAASEATTREGGTPQAALRTRDQRMADALDTLLAAATPPQATRASMEPGAQRSDAAAPGCAGKTDGTHHARPAFDAKPAPPVGSKAAEIIVRADLAALAGERGGIAEICGVGPIPPSTLQRLACNSDVWIEIFGDNLTPLYETAASRAPTAAQRRALIARDGVCLGCGEPPGECEAHHITPCQHGGKTRLDNLVLVCWRCHDLIHDHNWQITVRDGRYRLAPPTQHTPPNLPPNASPNIEPRSRRQRSPCGKTPQPDNAGCTRRQTDPTPTDSPHCGMAAR